VINVDLTAQETLVCHSSDQWNYSGHWPIPGTDQCLAVWQHGQDVTVD